MVRGTGEKLVSGNVTPNSYLLSRGNFQIVKKQERFKFNEEILLSIIKTGINIEEHYGMPQDIEWAIDKNNQLFILQTRAITK